MCKKPASNFYKNMRKLSFKKILIFLSILFGLTNVQASNHSDMIVDQNGNGDYRTISAAIDALPMFAYQRVVILIRNGVYGEKIRIDQNYVTLRGESRDSTIIQYNQLRSDWVANKDAIGPAVINIYGDDIILDNLTIENTQPEIGPHAFAVFGKGTRTILTNCNILSKGGDTVSLWNYKEGMYYHSNCYFQGAVDFVCPRGCCFIRDSKFYEVKETATLWHDGHFNTNQKFVIWSSSFDGVEGFQLGRHHYEAQFYLLDCSFSSNMADQPIYRHVYGDSTKNNPYYNGDRIYFYNCTKEGEAFSWYGNNLDEAKGSPVPTDITVAWTFDGKWDPKRSDSPVVTSYSINGKFLDLIFSEIVTVRGEAAFKNQTGKTFKIVKQRFNDINRLTFLTDDQIRKSDLSGDLILLNGDIIASIASVHERSIGSVFQIIDD